MRTIVDIPKDILQELDALARNEKISRAEAVRRAMAEFLEKRARARPDAGFGLWKSKQIDPLAYEDDLRGEWDR